MQVTAGPEDGGGDDRSDERQGSKDKGLELRQEVGAVGYFLSHALTWRQNLTASLGSSKTRANESPSCSTV